MIVYGLNWQIITVLCARYTVMLCFVVVTFFIHHTSRKNMLVQKNMLWSACKNEGRSGNRKQFFFLLRLILETSKWYNFYHL